MENDAEERAMACFRVLFTIHLDGMTEITKNLIQDNRSSCRDLNLEAPDCETGVTVFVAQFLSLSNGEK
jgi:hypothetical protein